MFKSSFSCYLSSQLQAQGKTSTRPLLPQLACERAGHCGEHFSFSADQTTASTSASFDDALFLFRFAASLRHDPGSGGPSTSSTRSWPSLRRDAAWPQRGRYVLCRTLEPVVHRGRFPRTPSHPRSATRSSHSLIEATSAHSNGYRACDLSRIGAAAVLRNATSSI